MSRPRRRPLSPEEFELLRKGLQGNREHALSNARKNVGKITRFVNKTYGRLDAWADVIDGCSPVNPEEVEEVIAECCEPAFPSTKHLAKLPSRRPSGSPRPSGSSSSPRPFGDLPGLYSLREPEELTRRLQKLRNEHPHEQVEQVEEDDEWEIIDTPMIFYLNLFIFLLRMFSSSVSLKKKIDEIVKTEGLSKGKIHAKFDLDKFNKLISEKIIVAEDFRSDSLFKFYSSLEEKLLLDCINEKLLIGRNFSSAVIAYVLLKTKFNNTHDYVETTLRNLETYFEYFF